MADQAETAAASRKPLNVIIVGGSCAGLMAGIGLKRHGHNVRILELAESSEREGLAAGMGLQTHVKKFFENEDLLKDRPLGVVNNGFSILDENLQTSAFLGFSINLTTWDSAYYRLRANFDGYKSSYIPDPPPVNPHGTEGEAKFIPGKRVQKVEDVKGRMTVFVQDTQTGANEKFEGDIIIAADGANSTIRRQLNPHLKREEPGYVIWRGTIPTKDLSPEVREKIENKPLICPYKSGTYLVIYTIPGENGSLEQGTRHINFVWYFWPKEVSLTDIMTDADGHYHRTTIPKGKIRPEVWKPQIEQARRLLNPTLVELVEKITDPFVSVVSSIASPKASYFNNRLFLIGDALCQTQPNVGMGTTLAAFAATTLVKEVICPTNGKPPLDPQNIFLWETKVLQETEVTRCRSVAFASWYLNSWPKVGYYYARYYAKLYWQYYFGGRRGRFRANL